MYTIPQRPKTPRNDVPPRHIAVFTSTSGAQLASSAVPAERAWEALAGARSRFLRPLLLAIVFSTAIADGAEWYQTDHPKRSQSVSRPADPGAQFGAPGRLVEGALLALFSLAANRRKRKLSSRLGCRLFFFFRTLVKYSLSDLIMAVHAY